MPLSVCAIAFNDISPFHLAVPSIVFGESYPDVPCFDFKVCACERGPLNTSAGYRITTRHGLSALSGADLIIVPSWRTPEHVPPPALLAALRTAYQRGSQIIGLCLGAYVLAAAGLLDGREATTHWAYAEDFRRRYPQVRLRPDVLYVDGERLMTSAGTAAGLDCCLHWLRRHFGADVANRVARYLVIPPHRVGDQAQYLEQPVPQSPGDTRMAGLLDELRLRLDQRHTLDSIAGQVLMSRRTLTRHFRQLTGSTVAGWLLAQRLARAQHLLECTGLSMEAIATQCGFGSDSAFRQHFRRQFHVSPRQWRESFSRLA